MPYLYLVAALVYKLDDVISEVCLYYFRYLLRVGKVKGYTGKSRIEHSTAYIIRKLAAHSSRTGVFRIKFCQRSKRSFAICYHLGIIAKFILYSVYFLLLNSWGARYNLHLYFCWHHRDTVFGQFAEIFAYIGRRYSNIFNKLFTLPFN